MIREEAKNHDLELEEVIPSDLMIAGYDCKGITIANLPDDVPAVTAVRIIAGRKR